MEDLTICDKRALAICKKAAEQNWTRKRVMIYAKWAFPIIQNNLKADEKTIDELMNVLENYKKTHDEDYVVKEWRRIRDGR